MLKKSAGLLMYKSYKGELHVFLVHPGGPFWKNKDKEAWSIPKGEIDDEKTEMFDTARREFEEEIGIVPPKEKEKYFYLGEVKQKSGKIVHTWAFEGDWSGLLICKSWVEIEWPLKSRKKIKIPEVDKAGFFSLEQAKEKMNAAQFDFVRRLKEKLIN